MSRFAASNSLFVSTCTTLLERMINTVPKNVVLSDIIEPVLVKPRALAIAVNPNGTMTISGTVRVSNIASLRSANRQFTNNVLSSRLRLVLSLRAARFSSN